GQSDPIASVLFSRTTISPPGPSNGAPETAKRPAVQRGGLGAACAGTSAATNGAASANRRSFEPIDISISLRLAARTVATSAPVHRSNAQTAYKGYVEADLSPLFTGRSEARGTMFPAWGYDVGRRPRM